MDVLTTEKRSALMSKIGSKNTRPEIVVRRAAHALGLRFRLHRLDLPGSPDLVFPRRRLAIFVHGCFWHRHEGCRLSYKPRSNVEFWESKFRRNVERDRQAMEDLRARDWQPEVIWECETRRPAEIPDRIRELIGDA